MICQVQGCTEHYGCRLRAKGISLSSAATPTRTIDRPHKFRPVVQPSWEKGREVMDRPGGFQAPILNDQGKPMGVHEAQSHRRRIEKHKRRIASGPVLED